MPRIPGSKYSLLNLSVDKDYNGIKQCSKLERYLFYSANLYLQGVQIILTNPPIYFFLRCNQAMLDSKAGKVGIIS